jgi:hypothetical protein
MATILVHPYNLTFTASQSAATNPASHLNVDYPNMVWKSTSSTGAYVTFQLDSALPWNFVGLVGANLFGADTIRVRAASSAAQVTSAPQYDQTFKVTGTEDANFNLAYLATNADRTLRFFRLDFTLTGNPNAFVQAQRLVVGKRLEADGIDIGSDLNFEDPSRVSEYRGIQIVDSFDVKQSWKFAISNVPSIDYNQQWRSFIKQNSGKGLLFIPDTLSGFHNQESVFGRIQAQTNGSVISNDKYKVNLYIREV